MELIKRQGIIIWLYTLKHLNKLKNYGYVHYVSDRMKYAVLYVDEDLAEETIDKLRQLHFVRKVEPSFWDTIDMTFEDSLNESLDESEVKSDTVFDEEFFEAITKQIKSHQAQD